MVAIVDDDDLMRSALQGLLKAVGLQARGGDIGSGRVRGHQSGDLGGDGRGGEAGLLLPPLGTQRRAR